MNSIEDVMNQNEYNAKCRAAIETLKIFMADAKGQLKTSIPLSTLELNVGTVDKE